MIPEAIELYLESLEARGDPIPCPIGPPGITGAGSHHLRRSVSRHPADSHVRGASRRRVRENAPRISPLPQSSTPVARATTGARGEAVPAARGALLR